MNSIFSYIIARKERIEGCVAVSESRWFLFCVAFPVKVLELVPEKTTKREKNQVFFPSLSILRFFHTACFNNSYLRSAKKNSLAEILFFHFKPDLRKQHSIQQVVERIVPSIRLGCT
jgi:hypothetical protein